MLRLFSAVRSTRTYIPAAVARRGYTSTVSQVDPLPESKSSSTPEAPSAKVEEQSAPSNPEQVEQVEESPAPQVVESQKVGEVNVAEPSESQTISKTTPIVNLQETLGLKYDPSTLPLEEPLDPRTETFSEEKYAASIVHGRSVNFPYYHPRTYDIPVANIHFRSHHIKLLNLFTHFASHAASSLAIPVSKVIPLPTQRSLWTVPRSPFVHKKSQENFDRRVHKRAIKAWDADPEVVERWIAYLRAHAMPGVGMRVTTWERHPIGIGQITKQKPSKNLPVTSSDEIRLVGEEIIKHEASTSSHL